MHARFKNEADEGLTSVTLKEVEVDELVAELKDLGVDKTDTSKETSKLLRRLIELKTAFEEIEEENDEDDDYEGDDNDWEDEDEDEADEEDDNFCPKCGSDIR